MCCKHARSLCSRLHSTHMASCRRRCFLHCLLPPALHAARLSCLLLRIQVVDEAQAVGTHCNIKASVWTGEGPNAVQANAYRTAGQLVVSTPGRIAQALESGLIQTSLLSRTLSMFVLDEADLLLLHEYESDLQAIAPQVSASSFLDDLQINVCSVLEPSDQVETSQTCITH